MNAAGKLCFSAFCRKKLIQIILQMSDSTTLLYMCKKVFWDVKFLISCEPHCQKFKTCFIYDFKTVINNELYSIAVEGRGAPTQLRSTWKIRSRRASQNMTMKMHYLAQTNLISMTQYLSG